MRGPRLPERLRKLARSRSSSSRNQTESTSSTQAVSGADDAGVKTSSHNDSHTIDHITELGTQVFLAAKSTLEDADQKTIDGLGLVDFSELALKDIKDCILAKQNQSSQHKWTTRLNGMICRLEDVAASVSDMLDKIQPAIDVASDMVGMAGEVAEVAAILAPIHIGIPVAILKAVAGIVVFESKQMDRLLSGVKLAVSMLRTVSLYFELLKRSIPSAPAEELRVKLVSAYAVVLELLAIGYRAYEKGAFGRVLELLWSKETVNDFEQRSNVLVQDLARAADFCFHNTSDLRLKQLLENELEQTERLSDIAAMTDKINQHVDLARLETVGSAAWDVVENPKKGEAYSCCLEGTREELLENIIAWCDKSDEKVYWMRGMAGTGKSTLVRTVAKKLSENGRTVVSFFFRQDLARQRNASAFWSTLAGQICNVEPYFREEVGATLRREAGSPPESIGKQYEELFKKPLLAARIKRLVLVIDALDECELNHARAIIMQLGSLAKESQLELRIIATSRPEYILREAFGQIVTDGIRLEQVESSVIQGDIRCFLGARFKAIFQAENRRDPSRPLKHDWPSQTAIDRLVFATTPLFIIAATLCRYVESYAPQRRLEQLLKSLKLNQSTTISDSKAWYSLILDHIFAEHQEDVLQDFQRIIAAIVLLNDPMPFMALCSLLDESRESVRHTLDLFHSVLYVPDTEHEPIRLLHKSFKDFLLSDGHKYTVDVNRTNSKLCNGSLRLLTELALVMTPFHEAISGRDRPYVKRKSVEDKTVDRYITSEYRYACLHWSSHVVDHLSDQDAVHKILEKYLLAWLEALSWLGSINLAVSHIEVLKSKASEVTAPRLLVLLEDIARFCLQFHTILDEAPLQLYYSVLHFTPSSSCLYSLYICKCRMTEIFDALPPAPKYWSRERLRLTFDSAEKIVLSDAGRTLAAANPIDGKVQAWNVLTGEPLLEVYHASTTSRTWIQHLIIDPTETQLAVVSQSGLIEVWLIHGEYIIHEGCVADVEVLPVFSPDGLYIAYVDNQLVSQRHTFLPVRVQPLYGAASLYIMVGSSKTVPVNGQTPSISSMAFDDTGDRLAVVLSNGELSTHGLPGRTGSLLQDRTCVSSERGELMSSAELADGNDCCMLVANPYRSDIFAGVTRQSKMWLWDGEGRASNFVGQFDQIMSISFQKSRPDMVAILSRSSGSIHEYDLERRTLRLVDHTILGGALAVSLSASRAVSYHEEGRCLSIVDLSDPYLYEAERSEQPQLLCAVCTAHRGKDAYEPGCIEIWDVVTGRLNTHIAATSGFAKPKNMLLSQDGQKIFLVKDDRESVCIVDTSSGETRQVFGGFTSVTQLALTSDERQLAIRAGNDIFIINISDGSLVCSMSASGQDADSDMQISPDGRYLLSAGKSSSTNALVAEVRMQATLWNMQSGALRAVHSPLTLDRAKKLNARFSPDSSAVALLSNSREVRLIDIQSDRLLLLYKHPREGLITLDFVHQGMSLCFRYHRSRRLIDISQHNLKSETNDKVGLPSVNFHDAWVQCQGQNLVLIPHQYRGYNLLRFGRTLVLGSQTGSPLFFTLREGVEAFVQTLQKPVYIDTSLGLET